MSKVMWDNCSQIENQARYQLDFLKRTMLVSFKVLSRLICKGQGIDMEKIDSQQNSWFS